MNNRSEPPRVLIGIYFRNSARTLPKALKALEALDYPKEQLRLLIVDEFSTDGSLEIAKGFCEQYKSNYREATAVELKGNVQVAKNYCIKYLDPDEFLWILDSDVDVTPDAIAILIQMAKKYDISALYYTHDRASDPPPISEVGPILSCKIGCALFSPKALRVAGLFNEKLGHAPEDAEYCLRATNNGLKIGFDPVHVQTHDVLWRRQRWYFPFMETIRRRKHKGWWLSEKIKSKRWLLYFALLVCLILISVSVYFALPLIAYFVAQSFSKKNLPKALGLTINALILPVASVVGYTELRLSGATTLDTLKKKYPPKASSSVLPEFEMSKESVREHTS